MSNWMDVQVKKLRELQNDPHRKERENGTNYGWNSPVGAIHEAYCKLTRVCVATPSAFHIATNDERYTAEECREAAHYLLRAAAMLERFPQIDINRED